MNEISLRENEIPQKLVWQLAKSSETHTWHYRYYEISRDYELVSSNHGVA